MPANGFWCRLDVALLVLAIGRQLSSEKEAKDAEPTIAQQTDIVEKLISWHVFWAIGVGYFYNFVMHGFFGRMSAAFIGWADSPFQFEVATASLGFSVVGFLAAFRSFDLRLGFQIQV